MLGEVRIRLCLSFNHRRCSVRKGVLGNFAKFTGKHLYQSLFFLIKLQTEAGNFIRRETLAQAISCEFCEFFKNTFLQNTSRRLLLDFSIWLLLRSLPILTLFPPMFPFDLLKISENQRFPDVFRGIKMDHWEEKG